MHSEPTSVAQTKANKLLDSIRGHSSSTLKYGGLRDTRISSTESGRATERASSVDDFNTVAFVLTEEGELSPVPKHQELVPPFPSKSTNTPFHYEDNVARFPSFLDRLCSGVQEHLRRLSFVWSDVFIPPTVAREGPLGE